MDVFLDYPSIHWMIMYFPEILTTAALLVLTQVPQARRKIGHRAHPVFQVCGPGDRRNIAVRRFAGVPDLRTKSRPACPGGRQLVESLRNLRERPFCHFASRRREKPTRALPSRVTWIRLRVYPEATHAAFRFRKARASPATASRARRSARPWRRGPARSCAASGRTRPLLP